MGRRENWGSSGRDEGKQMQRQGGKLRGGFDDTALASLVCGGKLRGVVEE